MRCQTYELNRMTKGIITFTYTIKALN